mgnify:CR=1 FL=1
MTERRKKRFAVKVNCMNCCGRFTLNFDFGTDLREIGIGEDVSIKVELPSGKWEIAECPNCGSDKLIKKPV